MLNYGATLTRQLAPSCGVMHRVEILNAAGDWIDLRAWFQSATWSEDVDAGSAAGSLRLRREARVGGVLTSLAPLIEGSSMNIVDGEYAPAVSPFRRMRISSAFYDPAGVPPRGTDEWDAWYAALTFREVFLGIVDDPSWGGKASVLDVPIRDLAGPLQDTLIESEREYGAPLPVGQPIADVMNQLLADNGFEDPGDGRYVTFVLGDTENWSLGPYRQPAGVKLWDALRARVLQMGWDFRYWRYDDGTFRITMRKPRRDTLTADLTLTTAQFADVPKLRLNGSDVRNAGQLTYTDEATGGVATVTSEDAGSIAAFGRRPFGVKEEAANGITKRDRAQDMLDRMTADIATPYVEQDAVLPYLPQLQLGDVLEFPATGTPFYDALQRFGVVRITHEISPTKNKTTVQLRGRPIGAYRRWLVLLGVALDPDAPTPSFTVTASGSPDGGIAKDGSVWVAYAFEKNTEHLIIASETGPTLPLIDPDDSDNSRNYIIRRPDGFEAVMEYAGTVRIATTHHWWRNLAMLGIGWRGKRGRTNRALVQAIDGVSGFVPNGFTAFNATRTNAGTSALLTWTGTPTPTVTDEQIFVYQNGARIAELSPEALSHTVRVVDPDRSYTYEIARFSQGIEGPRLLAVLAVVNTTTAPQWVGGTPLLTVHDDGTRGVSLAWTCTDPAAVTMRADASLDGVDYTRTVGTLASADVGSMEDGVVARQFYRLAALDVDGNVLAYSAAMLFPGVTNPTPASGLAARFSLTLGYVSGDPKLRIAWTCADPAAVGVRIQRDEALGDGWVDVEDNAPASGGVTFLDDVATFAYYRVLTLDGADTVLATSARQRWKGWGG